MKKMKFNCDYMEGVHPRILERLVETNLEQTAGYGNDPYCVSAKKKILEACQCPDGEVHFLVGGTQTNATVIAALLHMYDGVLAAETGHVNVHEAGAIEYTGHKVLTLPQKDGKISAESVENYLKWFYADENHEQMVQPGMVYLTHPTEYGTLYTAEELKAIHGICQRYAIPLYVDGARLGYALAARKTDVTLPVLAQNCDIFYIGGPKVGAFCGEAVVIPKKGLIPKFFTTIKQHGALLAKGRLIGIQFDTLFTDGLYQEISAHAIRMAEKLKKALMEKGYTMYLDSPTNQQFIVVDEEKLKRISRVTTYGFWCKYDENHTVIRLATSWATKPEDVTDLLANI